MAGQGTLALELLADFPELDMLAIPVGGGGLIGGCAVAACGIKPGIEVVGVEVAAYAPLAQRLAGQPVSVGGPTIAEGIAVRDIGEKPFAAIRANVADVLVVPERAVEAAIAMLAEEAKLVAEGAGAAGVAALLAFPERFAGRRVGVPVCGGNIDSRIHDQRDAAQPAARRAADAAAFWRFRTGRACSRTSRAALVARAAISSTCRIIGCSPRPRCRRRSSR